MAQAKPFENGLDGKAVWWISLMYYSLLILTAGRMWGGMNRGGWCNGVVGKPIYSHYIDAFKRHRHEQF